MSDAGSTSLGQPVVAPSGLGRQPGAVGPGDSPLTASTWTQTDLRVPMDWPSVGSSRHHGYTGARSAIQFQRAGHCRR